MERQLLKRMLDGETPFKTNSRNWFGLNILDILFAKTKTKKNKKKHNMVQILQRVAGMRIYGGSAIFHRYETQKMTFVIDPDQVCGAGGYYKA